MNEVQDIKTMMEMKKVVEKEMAGETSVHQIWHHHVNVRDGSLHLDSVSIKYDESLPTVTFSKMYSWSMQDEKRSNASRKLSESPVAKCHKTYPWKFQILQNLKLLYDLLSCKMRFLKKITKMFFIFNYSFTWSSRRRSVKPGIFSAKFRITSTDDVRRL